MYCESKVVSADGMRQSGDSANSTEQASSLIFFFVAPTCTEKRSINLSPSKSDTYMQHLQECGSRKCAFIRRADLNAGGACEVC